MKRVACGIVAAFVAAWSLSARDARTENLLARPDAAADTGPDASARLKPWQRDLDAAARALVNDPVFAGAAIGIEVVDLASGQKLAAVHEHTPLNPASNAKLYTAGAALAMLHANHRYETTLSGKLEGEAVSGPLVLRGYGDPSLTTQDLWELVQELRGYGVKRVDGDVLVDQGFYDEQTTPPAFDQQPGEWSGFRAPVSAVALDENCITLTVRPVSGSAMAHLEFDPPGFVELDGTVRVVGPGAADNVELALSSAPGPQGGGARMIAHVHGAIASDSRLVRYTRRAEDPRLLAGFALRALLDRAEIRVAGEVKLGGDGKGRVIAKHVSQPVSTLLYELGKQSDNFYAEMIFKSLAGEAKAGADPAKTADAAELVAEWLGRIGAMDNGLAIKNGSGLFDANRVTAESTVALLRWAYGDPEIAPEFIAQLSVGGVDGTLRKRFRQSVTRRHVRAKTGTLDDVIALSGYVLGETGERGPLAFSILFNRIGGKQDVARRAADRFVETLARAVTGP